MTKERSSLGGGVGSWSSQWRSQTRHRKSDWKDPHPQRRHALGAPSDGARDLRYGGGGKERSSALLWIHRSAVEFGSPLIVCSTEILPVTA